MPICGDYGGRTASGQRCQRNVDPGVRCWQHQKESARVLELVSGGDSDPFPSGALTPQARRAWHQYSQVVPEHEWSELYSAILALNATIKAGAELAQDGPTVEDPVHGGVKAHPASIVKSRQSSEWENYRKSLKLEERLAQVDDDDEVDKLFQVVE